MNANHAHAKALQSFARSLRTLLVFRMSVQFVTVWFFAWGAAVLALRMLHLQSAWCLALGPIGILPLLLVAAGRVKAGQAPLAQFRANYDRLNDCGGIIMAEEAGDMAAWAERLPAARIPRFQWQSGRALFLLGVSALFAATAILLPERLTHLYSRRPLEIGQTVGQLQAEIKGLTQEKIIDEKKAEAEQEQLARVQKDSFGYDPDKTWEALDHLKQANADQARQAAEEILAKTEKLSEAETMAQGMEQAADSGMNEATASQAAQDLASMLNAAKLEEGIFNGKIPPELLSGLNGLNKEQLEKLMRALQFKKSAFGRTLTNLANLKMIDAATLSQCDHAGQCHNPNALAEYLSTCTNGCTAAECEGLCANNGLSRGGPGAPMTWTDGASEKDLKFQEHALPPASKLSDAQLIGVSKSAPELTGNGVVAGHGALDQAAAGGGAAQLQLILPEQRQAVRAYFKREN